jgi:hypothetical protein
MRTLIQFWGLSRTGNHAVIDWIMAQHQDAGYEVIHHNNKNPKNCYESVKPYLPKAPTPDYREQPVLCVYNFENYSLHDVPTIPDYITANFPKIMNVMVCRDPFNYVSSKLNSMFRNHFKENVISLWLMYGYEALGQTSYLGSNKVVVNFNRWNVDKDYREKLTTERFGIPFSDAGFHIMSKIGKSSFDKLVFTPDPDIHSRVLNRWQKMLDSQEYRDYFRGRDDVFEVSKRLFGPIEGTEVLLT